MSVSTSIKSTIIDKINALASTQSVYGYERLDPQGWPAVIVVAGNMDGEFTSTTENRRLYAYDVTIMFPLSPQFTDDSSDPIPQQEYAENRVAAVVDDIINDIDSDFELSGNVNVLFVDAADAKWGVVDYEGGKAKACQITLTVTTDYNVNS